MRAELVSFRRFRRPRDAPRRASALAGVEAVAPVLVVVAPIACGLLAVTALGAVL